MTSILAPTQPKIDLSPPLGLLNNSVDSPIALEDLQESSQVLSHAVDSHSRRRLMESLQRTRDRARLNSLGLQHAGDYLNAIPSRNLDLHLNLEEFRVNVQYRLGMPIFDGPGACLACQRDNDEYGDHAISCGMQGERISRHNALRDDLHRTAITANLSSRREARHLLPGVDARPADVFIRRWIRHQDTAFDVTVINPLQQALVDQAANNPGYALEIAKRRKNEQSFEVCRRENIIFIPLPVETFGAWHPEAIPELRRIARALARETGKEEKSATQHLFQRLSISLARGNASLFLSRKPDSIPVDLVGNDFH